MILYIYSKCSTCKNALSFLEKNNIAFIRKEITVTPPSIAELQQMLNHQNGNVRKLFNTSGLLYKEMKIKDLKLSVEDSLKLLHKHGMLVKRPFLLSDKAGLLGFKETEWAHLFL